MSTNNPFQHSPAKSSVAALRARQDLKLPKEIKAAFEKLGQLEMLSFETKRNVPARAAVIDGIIRDVAVDDAALMAAQLHPARVEAIEEAVELQLSTVYGLIRRNAQPLIESIREVIYTPALDRVLALAEKVTANDTPAGLLRAGKPELAQEWVACEVTLDRMAEALELRTTIFGGVMADGSAGQRFNVGQMDQWQAPDLAASVWDAKRDRLANVLASIAAGAKPWLPLPAEADARRTAYLAEAKDRYEEANRGRLPSFG